MTADAHAEVAGHKRRYDAGGCTRVEHHDEGARAVGREIDEDAVRLALLEGQHAEDGLGRRFGRPRRGGLARIYCCDYGE